MSEINPDDNAQNGDQSPTPKPETKPILEKRQERSIDELVRELSQISVQNPTRISPSSIGVDPAEAETVFEEQNSASSYTLGAEPIVLTPITPAYISYLLVSATSTILSKAEVQFKDENGNISKAKFRVTSEGFYRADVGTVAREIKILRSSRGKQVRILGGHLVGYTGTGSANWIHTFHEFSELVEYCRNQLEGERASIITARATPSEEKTSLQTDREKWGIEQTKLKGDLQGIQDATQTAAAEKTAVMKQLDDVKADLATNAAAAQTQASRAASAQAQADALDKEIGEKHLDMESLSSKISQQQAELKQINSNATIMATSLTGYGQQGKNQARWYFWFAVACALSGLGVAYVSYVQISEIWKDILGAPNAVSVSILVATRLTMFAVFSATIGGLFALARFCVKRVVQIDDRTLRLSEISVLAGNVTSALPYPPGVTENQKREVFFATRTMLVRDLLSGTFEILRKSSKQDKEKLLEGFKIADLIELAKTLKDSEIIKSG